jgi:hypothetical protein
MKRMDWLDDKREEITSLYNEGKKQTEIAQYFDVSQTAISTRLRKWGLSNPDGNRFIRFEEIDEETVRRMYWDEEMHPVQIAKKYGCHKQVVVNRMKEWGIPLRTKSQARVGKLNPIYGVGHTKDTCKKMSDAFDNGKRSSFGYSGNWGKVNLYKTPNQGIVKMRSGWEAKTADYLTDNGIDWYYESVWLELPGTKYLPDFYLPEYNIFIEVKGRLNDRGIEKVISSRQMGNKILLWDAEELLKRKIINNPGTMELYNKYKGYDAFVDNWESYK